MTLIKRIKKAIKILLNSDVSKIQPVHFKGYGRDYNDFENKVFKEVSPFTMTGHIRVISLLRSVEYLNKNKIEGAIVECGVWKGGSVMAALKALEKDDFLRDVYLYDTFEGMSEPTEVDKNQIGKLAEQVIDEDDFQKCISSLDDVIKNVKSTGYPTDNLHFIKGKVEDSIPNEMPKKIALLRLDTDWYESTLHELNHLFPLLVKDGVLIIDDYGHWNGCRKAVDEYFSNLDTPYFMHRVDYTCRLIIKKG